jgi:hypothetical protein
MGQCKDDPSHKPAFAAQNETESFVEARYNGGRVMISG